LSHELPGPAVHPPTYLPISKPGISGSAGTAGRHAPVLADYRSYVDCQDRAGVAWADQERWSRMSILNTARSGFFSSDRTVRDYCRDIWHAKPMPITPDMTADPGIPPPGS